MNFPVHSYTCCSDTCITILNVHSSMNFDEFHRFTASKRWQTLFFFGACCKRCRHLYTTTAPSCCIPASYCRLSTTLQKPWVSLLSTSKKIELCSESLSHLQGFHLTLPRISIVKLTRCTISQIYLIFGTALYMFRTVSLSIIRGLRLYIQHQVYVIQVLLSAC